MKYALVLIFCFVGISSFADLKSDAFDAFWKEPRKEYPLGPKLPEYGKKEAGKIYIALTGAVERPGIYWINESTPLQEFLDHLSTKPTKLFNGIYIFLRRDDEFFFSKKIIDGKVNGWWKVPREVRGIFQ